MNETTEYTETQIEDWKAIFGAGVEYNGWWQAISHLDGSDWKTPGRVTLVIDNPDYEGVVPVSKTLEAADIFAALRTAMEKYPWGDFVRHPVYGDLDLDASSADVALQIALFGDVVYG